jgi:hypothetical protein
MRNCKGIKVLAIIKELNGIDSGFILINLKIKHPSSTINGNKQMYYIIPDVNTHMHYIILDVNTHEYYIIPDVNTHE